jgi:hypothetical protein
MTLVALPIASVVSLSFFTSCAKTSAMKSKRNERTDFIHTGFLIKRDREWQQKVEKYIYIKMCILFAAYHWLTFNLVSSRQGFFFFF